MRRMNGEDVQGGEGVWRECECEGVKDTCCVCIPQRPNNISIYVWGGCFGVESSVLFGVESSVLFGVESSALFGVESPVLFWS